MNDPSDASQLPAWLTAIGTIGLALVAAFQDQIRAALARPRLVLRFRQTPPMCRLSSRSFPEVPNLRERFFDFHFQVENEGRSQARRVEAFLEAIWVHDASNTPKQIEGFWPVKLRYDNKGTLHLDLNPHGPPVYWNLGFIPSPVIQGAMRGDAYIEVPGADDKGLRFYLDVLDRPFFQPNTLPPGNYSIKVSVYSENAARVDSYFGIIWTGNWKEDEQKMFEEIRITQVKTVT